MASGEIAPGGAATPTRPGVNELGARLQHTLISPRVAYLLLVVGLSLIVFEFFAASVGFAAAVGALAALSAAYGFSHLPVVWWAVVLLAGITATFAVVRLAASLLKY